MKQLRLFYHDVRQGMIYNGYKLLLPVLIGFIGAMTFIRMYGMSYGSMENVTLLECMTYMYKGGKYIPPDMVKDIYVLPAVWLGIQIVIGYLVGYYPMDDLHTYGQQVLIRSRKRTSWWLSKCVWNTVTVIFTYVVIMPVVVSVAVSLLQMALGMMFSPMIGFIVVEGWALCATFTVSGFAIHNYGALAHTIITCPSDIKYSVGCVVCLVVVSVAVGAVYFNRCNILAKE